MSTPETTEVVIILQGGSLRPCTPTYEQKQAAEVARVGFMAACPFYAHYFYAEMKECPTLDIPTACTDGRTIWYNPEYLLGLKPSERVFVFAHEVDHVISRHPSRMKHYRSAKKLHDMQWSDQLFNVAADYVINARLQAAGVGTLNPDWLFRQDVTGDDLPEDVYRKLYKENPPNGKGKGQGNKTWGQSSNAPKGAKGDPQARAQGGSFDVVLEPPTDPVTGAEDLPDDAQFKEAIARAAAAAKAMGKLPAGFQRMVDEILQPQIDWTEHVRMLVTGRIGSRSETWTKLNRRRLVLNPMICLPGRRGYGADTVVVVRDTSGSIGEKELAAFNGEIGGILQDVKPRRILVLDCDASVHQTQEVTSLDEAQAYLGTAKGGGGTSFIPPFEQLAKDNIRPDALIYLTDMYGSFPQDEPPFPVIWCSTSQGQNPPWGDLVEIKVG